MEYRVKAEVIEVPIILYPLYKLLPQIDFAKSNNEAIRLIKGDAVEIIRPNGMREKQEWKRKEDLSIIGNDTIIHTGRKWLKLKITEENCNYFMEVWDLPEDLPPGVIVEHIG